MVSVAIAMALVMACTGCGAQAVYRGPEQVEDARPAPPDARGDAPLVAVFPRAIVRDRLPEARETRRFEVPKPTEARLSNGIRVLVLERHEFPFASIAFVLDRGASDARPEVASAYASMLLRGTESSSREELAGYLYDFGIEVDTDVGPDHIVLSLKALTPFVGRAVTAGASMMREPSLLEKELDAVRRARAASLDRREGAPRTTMHAAVLASLFPAAHPYRHARGGTSGEAAAVTVEEVRAFFRDNVTSDRLAIVAVGDVDAAALLASLERRFADVPKARTRGAAGKGGSSAVPAPSAAVAKPAPPFTLLHHPGETQSQLAVAFPGVPRGHADEAPLRVLGAMLAGSSSSRLDRRLRHRHGFTYGVHGAAYAMRKAGTFEIHTAVEARHTATALRALLEEIDALEDGITDDEIARAQNQLAAAQPGRFESNDSAALALAAIAASGDRIEAARQRDEAVARVTQEDVLRVAREYLRPERRRIVVRGDASSIGAPLEALGFGALAATPDGRSPR